jgi:hypothetical protein
MSPLTFGNAFGELGDRLAVLCPHRLSVSDIHRPPALAQSIEHNDLPDWADRIGRSTLVIIDEAGMADTISLDTAVRFTAAAVAVSGRSVMINNSLRSVPVASSATSKPATAPSG